MGKKEKDAEYFSDRWGAANVTCFARWHRDGHIEVRVDMAHTDEECEPGSSGWQRLEQEVPFVAQGIAGFQQAYRQFREVANAGILAMFESGY